MKRCFGNGDSLYEAYHDKEWGKPIHDDHRLFEFLVLEGAQAGLSWRLILGRREGYRKAFHHFDPAKVAKMTDEDLDALLKSDAIIRNKLKVYSARDNARIFLNIQKEFGSFDDYLWSYTGKKTINGEWKSFDQVPCQSPLSEKISHDLKRKGMRFVGPKIIYSFLQAVGVLNDHAQDCPFR